MATPPIWRSARRAPASGSDAMTRATPAVIGVALFLLIGTSFAKADDTAALGHPITDPVEITRHMAGNTLSGVLKETGESWVEFYCDTGRSLYEFGGINL